MADDAGALLVRSGLVSSSALDEARAKVADRGGTLGEQLVASGVVADDALTDFYKQRLLVPQVNPNTLARLAAKVVAVIPSDMAIELRAIPVSLDAENNLTVAMSDPSDRHAVDEIAFFTGTFVIRAVATQMQIAWCLAHYYGHVTFLGKRLLQPDGVDVPEERVVAAVRPRTRGVTGEIDAMRHRGIVPGTAVVGTITPVADTDGIPEPPEVGLESDDTAKAPRAHSISGEIRVQRRALSVKPPLPPDESGPVITVELDGEISAPQITIEGGTAEPPDDRLAPPKRLRPAEPDPPELAARAGEVSLKDRSDRQVLAGPSIVIDDAFDDASPETVDLMPTAPLGVVIEVSGEVIVRARAERDAEPATPTISVELDDESSTPLVITDSLQREAAPVAIEDPASQPILLERKRASAAIDGPSDDALTPSSGSPVVTLPTKKPQGRVDRITDVGLGAVGAPLRTKHDTEEMGAQHGSSIPSELDDAPTGQQAVDLDPTRVDTRAAPRGDTSSDEILAAPRSPVHDDDSSPVVAPPLPSQGGPSGQIRLTGVMPASRSPDDGDDELGDSTDVVAHGRPTAVMTAVELDAVIPGRSTDVIPAHVPKRAVDYDPVDDGWGPPGTTIPPPLLGAIPGAVEPVSGIIPIPNLDAQPLMVAPPSPPERPGRPHTSSESGLTRALEQATAHVLDLIRNLEYATLRDDVVATMVAHLAESHRRAGFLATRGGELSLFSIVPELATMPTATLRLDRPSTLQDLVGTRLPYRGPMHDDASRSFLAEILGACPPEILLVPITVRERVVGVLFGEHRMRHTFDDQLALAGRAAGIALERILKAKRG